MSYQATETVVIIMFLFLGLFKDAAPTAFAKTNPRMISE
jgi:hypothetical protein